MVRCHLCKKEFSVISNTHLKATHNIDIPTYSKKYGNVGVGFLLNVVHLPKNDERYKKWRSSLDGRNNLGWSRGLTKATSRSVAKMSLTFKKRHIDNFLSWRKSEAFKERFKPPVELIKNGDLAFLIGLTLGDGHVYKFDRTEGLRITLGTDKPLLWKYAANLIQTVFKKKPSVAKDGNSNCMRLTLYQKNISGRLGIPTGDRGSRKIVVPNWILMNNLNMLRYLRGLYEAEGSHCVHLPTSTYKLFFSNRNKWMIKNVYTLMKKLGFHPHVSTKNFSVQISRKEEVLKAIDLLQFRKY